MLASEAAAAGGRAERRKMDRELRHQPRTGQRRRHFVKENSAARKRKMRQRLRRRRWQRQRECGR